ncbi:hypothetical protein PR202_gb28614 [Eleusine coracana subsp. coracana]|uniref:Uncharacterized protein n=1 Tax=Eleusine coracana subsp. coracana TaxID=191504 RepID=A0AAV5FXY9_ELECO|nr:hypothetical protein PR202_gb28614 [Eleusine coracana subsp. coracana]
MPLTSRSAATSSARLPRPPRAPRRLRRRQLKATPTTTAHAAAAGGGHRGGPATPHLRWIAQAGEGNAGGEKPRGDPVSSSVRRLAAAVWRLRPPEEAVAAGERNAAARVGLEHIPRHLQAQLLRKDPLGNHQHLKNDISSPNSVLEPHSGELHKVQLRLASGLENATRWEPVSIKGIEPDGAYVIASELNLMEEQQGESFVANLQMELQRARDRVTKLETERVLAKKQLDHLFKKLVEEKAAWRNREHKKVKAILEDIKADLDHEKKNRRQLETINLKLVDELKEVKGAANQLLQEYDNERKTRELTEEVCNKLVREIEEYKTEIEALKNDSLKLRGEVDEDRKLLQMAEVWREERVQMKLVDAKLALEEKYEQLSRLQQHVEAFISTFNSFQGDSTIIQKAENIVQVIGSVRSQDVEFTYEPPRASEDILSIFEDLRPKEESHTNEETEIKETEPCHMKSYASCESEIQDATPLTDIFLKNGVRLFPDGSPYGDNETEDGSSWETMSHEEMQASNRSPYGSEPSMNKIFDRISWTSGNDSEGVHSNKLCNDLSNMCLADNKQLKKKESAISKFWKSSPLKSCEFRMKDADDVIKGRSSNASLPSALYSTKAMNQDMGLNSPSTAQWSSPDSMNSQLNRGFRGCMELVQKQSLKAKLLEARMETQKIQIRHVLNQKT